MRKNLLVAGGDRRSLLLAQELKKDGFQVETAGFEPGDVNGIHPENTQAVLLPYPFSVKDGMIRSESGCGFPFQALLDRVVPGTVIFHHGQTVGEGEDVFHWRLYDSDPDFVGENAAISAEGAIHALMGATDDSLRNLRCLVTGYGVFARALVKRLLPFGTNVTVAARREEALRLAELDGAKTIFIDRLKEELGSFDVLLNTVPAQVLDDDCLMRLKTGCLLMELAGQKGGFDRQKANELGKKVLFLPGIPGKYAPLAAAKALKRMVLSSLEG